MRKICALLFLSVWLCAVAGAQTPDEVRARVDALFAQWDKPTSPGAALVVIRDGQIIYQRGYGMASLEHNSPITPETAFYICSTSKQFTAFSIALLAEEGRISLDDDIRKYVPELPERTPTITIRHLVHHQAGLRDFLTLWSLTGRSFADWIPEEEALALIARQKGLNFTSGTQYSYTNSGYFLMGVIIKRVTGKSLREYAEEKIFRPLGMHNSGFNDDRTRVIARRAIGHTPGPNGTFSVVRTSFDLVGDGGLFTTAADLAKWDQNFYHNRLGKGSPALIERVLTKSRFTDGKEHFYGFGLGINEYRGLRMIDHSGSFIGFTADLIRFPEEKFSVIVLANLATVDSPGLARRVADIYLADRFKSPVPAPRPPEQQPATAAPVLTAEQLTAYAGDYYSEELDAVWVLRVESGQLKARVRYNPARVLAPNASDRFTSFGGLVVQFARDGNGRINGFVLDVGRVNGVRFTRKQSTG